MSTDEPLSSDAESQSAAEKTEEKPEATRRRFRLNPTVNADDFKAVPNLAMSAAASAEEESSAAEPVAEQPAPEESAPLATEAQAETPGVASPEPPAEPVSEPAESPVAATSPAESELETTPAEEEAALEEVERSRTFTARVPVELPSQVDELDATLEAEIAAAMSLEETVTDVEPPPADAESAEQQPDEESLEPGTKLTGKVQSIHADNVFFDLGYRCPGIAQLRQFGSGKRPAIGQDVELIVEQVDEAEGLIQVNLPRTSRRVGGNWDAVSVGQVVDCMVTKSNKGGLEVSVSSLRGFMPAGQVDLGYVADLEPYIGQKLRVQVLEVNPRKRNLVVSRRALLEEDRKDAEEMLWAKLEVGQTYSGTIKTIKPYGAFVDLGGVDGFLHIGEISWSHINHPTDVIHEGQEVDVKVLSLDSEKRRIGLGMRQMTPNPWALAVEKYAAGTTVTGTVTRTANFGAFVELEPGIEGLVHISELDYRRVKNVAEVLSVGQEADFQVLEVDPERKRISLSLKALQKKPEPEEKPGRPADRSPQSGGDAVPRKRREDLRGGMGDQSPGKLFGNPRDFK